MRYVFTTIGIVGLAAVISFAVIWTIDNRVEAGLYPQRQLNKEFRKVNASQKRFDADVAKALRGIMANHEALEQRLTALEGNRHENSGD